MSAGKLPDAPVFTPPGQRIELYNKLYSCDEVFNQFIPDIRNADSPLAEEEKLYQLQTGLYPTQYR
jgi:hypothetical protein